MILVSACLLGHKTKYNGGSNPQELLLKYNENKKIIPICPECLGLLKIPHPPAEIQDGTGSDVLAERSVVKDKNGNNVTANFVRGAAKTAELAKSNNIKYAILKERSPSCGVKQIYDGSFSGRVISGQGVCTAYLRSLGITIYSEEELTEELLQRLLIES